MGTQGKEKRSKRTRGAKTSLNSTEEALPGKALLCYFHMFRNAICLSPPLFSPKQNCVSVSNVFNFSCDDCNTQEKFKKKAMQNLGEGVRLFVCFFLMDWLPRSINTLLRDHCGKIPKEKDIVNQKTVFTSAYPLAKAAYDNVIRFTGFFCEIP